MTDPAQRRPLGRSGLTVSALGIGGGSSFVRAGTEAARLVDEAWNAGLRYFDTAPLYGDGESERALGLALRGRPRSDFVLSTKVGRLAAHSFDYSAAGVRASLARSLERLRLDRVDIALVHDVDPDMHGAGFEARFREAVDGAYVALAELKAQGALDAIGIGLKDWNVALRLLRAAPFDCVMLAGGHTLLQHGALAELLPWCEAHDVGVLLAAPFNTGILATGAVSGARYYYEPAPAAILERTAALERLCARHGVSLAAAALQFPLLHPAIASVVVGHERAAEVGRNVALASHPIPHTLWQDMKAQGLLPLEAPTGRGGA